MIIIQFLVRVGSALAFTVATQAVPASAAVTYLFYANVDNRFTYTVPDYMAGDTVVAGTDFNFCRIVGLPCRSVFFQQAGDVGVFLNFRDPTDFEEFRVFFPILLDRNGFAFSSDGFAIFEISGSPGPLPPAPPGPGVPEPSAWAMLIAGFGIVGFSLRRRAARAV